ncbi:hypothetical protein ACP4OV_022646 [Aristida adscensionis]
MASPFRSLSVAIVGVATSLDGDLRTSNGAARSGFRVSAAAGVTAAARGSFPFLLASHSPYPFRRADRRFGGASSPVELRKDVEGYVRKILLPCPLHF